MRGRVKWFNPKKGYGFITTDVGDDVFVHFSEIKCEGFKTLKENAEVEFDLSTGDNWTPNLKGPQATNVMVV